MILKCFQILIYKAEKTQLFSLFKHKLNITHLCNNN